MTITVSDTDLNDIAKKVAEILNNQNSKNKKSPLPRMRLLKEATIQLRKDDPSTCVTEHMIRELALSGEVKSVMVGQKRLINYDNLLTYFAKKEESA
jgi:hypothetical protein